MILFFDLPKWSGDFKYGPCPPARDFGSRVSGLVFSVCSMFRCQFLELGILDLVLNQIRNDSNDAVAVAFDARNEDFWLNLIWSVQICDQGKDLWSLWFTGSVIFTKYTLSSNTTVTKENFIVLKLFIMRNSALYYVKAHNLLFVDAKSQSTGSSGLVSTLLSNFTRFFLKTSF